MNLKNFRKTYVFLLLLFASYSTLLGQQLIGKIYENQTGKPIQGAQITIEGVDGSAVSNKDGRFSLKISRGEYFVKISKNGYVTYNSLTRFGVADYQLNVAMRASSDLTQEETEVGTRDINNRTYTDTPVAIDNIKVEQFADAFGQLDLSQLLHFVLPSFNSNRQSGSDGADHVDPSVLRGLGQDQVLVLINGKRKHQASLVYLFGTTGRGNTPTDLNTIPVASIERVEVLRDGASAQYGSDAIAGVINIVLRSDTNGLKFNTNHSISNNGDGVLQNYSLHYGKGLKNEGFFDVTADFLGRGRMYRPATIYSDVPRLMFGDTKAENYSLYFNTESPLSRKQKAFFYAFGGVQLRNTDANSWTYEANNERNIKAIYPNGFEPHIVSQIWDGTFSVGLKTKTNKKWNFDLNNTFGQNQMHYSVANTLNSSLGAKSPRSFDAGGFGLMQNVTGVNITRKFRNGLKNTNVAIGSELRVENYYIFAGEEGSWKKYPNAGYLPGGAQTFPGFRPENELSTFRTNLGAYADVETDITRSLLLTFATRFERYSDFGNSLNAKVSFRVKPNELIAFRGSASTGFRAPSLAQSHFSAIYNDVVDGISFEKFWPPTTVLSQKHLV
ncbi:TonB-dependent receptor [Runella sp.]|uniref:TonB-dependent receptor n=1 Tax=Runella sp. TaxID=1960881 RepID=UPI003D0B6BA8